MLAPAIAVASDGFLVNANFSRLVGINQDKFSKFPATAALYLKSGKPPAVGTVLRNPDLARAYRELGAGGVQAFYTGKMGRAVIDAVNRPTVAAGVSVRPGNMTNRARRPHRAPCRGS